MRKYGAEFERVENVGENKTAIVQYLLKHLSVDKLKMMVQNFVHAFVGRSNPFQVEAFSVI